MFPNVTQDHDCVALDTTNKNLKCMFFFFSLEMKMVMIYVQKNMIYLVDLRLSIPNNKHANIMLQI